MMIYNGFKFGLLLQFAVGPLCLLTFNTAINDGLPAALIFALAIVLGDTLYIVIACLGSDILVEKVRKASWLQYVVGSFLIFIGLKILLSLFVPTSLMLMPAKEPLPNIFLKGLILTVANPLTIIFWCGVFSSQIITKKLSAGDLSYFALGCSLSSAFFLSTIALLGSVTGTFLPQIYLNLLNICVSFFLIYHGYKCFYKEKKQVP